MPDEPEEGFTFRDRRRTHSEPSSRPEPAAETPPPPPPAPPAAAPRPAAPSAGAAPPGAFFGAPAAAAPAPFPFGGDVEPIDTGEMPEPPPGMPGEMDGAPGDIPDVREYMVEFLMMLRSLAAIRLGLIPNPANGRPEKDLEQARIAIDTITFLVQQLEPSIAPQERLPLRAMVSDLRLRYVEETRGGA